MAKSLKSCGFNKTPLDMSMVLFDEIIEILAFNAGNQLETYGNEKLKYDANGNRTADGKYSYTWNEADQLTTITKQGETTPFAKYKYDDDGRRIEKEVNGQITRYFYDGDI
ncbi:hypothetical protein BK702_09320 [Bacillus thuringiensis serovar cameroun]|nr:hypothetical protein BK702_09320 [Bacillus thuringiensis serovar cameroun]